ncbi:FMN-dependent NADH-azoreductase [Pararhizobium sp.]|uniref:FMN-dependent NADH-azoreductase n=1 Tax=Pararhizobium sp. TaxID=1977563 RepID=UPI003D104F05
MKILHLICSPRGHASQSAAFSRHLVEKLTGTSRGSEVAVRCLSSLTMPHVDREYSLASRSGSSADAEEGSLQLSKDLISEIVESDAIVLATPMHNLSLPSALKAWIDHVVRPDMTFRYSGRKMIGLLPDRPVFIVLSSSENLCDDEDQDFLRPYVRAMFAAMGIFSVEFFGLNRGAISGVAGIINSADAMSILARSKPTIAHEAVHALWSQFC